MLLFQEVHDKTLLYKKNKKVYNSLIKYLIKEDKKTENKDKRNITRKKINDVKRGMINELQHMKNKKMYRELEREIEAEKESLEC